MASEKKTAAKIFIENYVNEDGYSDVIFVEDLIAKHGDQFASNNGCQWARDSEASCKFYNVKRFNAKEMEMTDKYHWNKIVAIQFQGKKEAIINHTIPTAVKTALKNIPCAVLGVIAGNMEIDHKNGRYNQDEYADDDFQSLSKAVNDAKREHCKKCAATGCRFKATMLGYSVDYIEGDENSPTCRGCYWYDPKEFNKQISANFTKN